MESALIISCTDKGTSFFTELLRAAFIAQIAVMKSCKEARQLLVDRDFDLVIINAPLGDETGEGLARHIAAEAAAQVILVVKSEHFDAVSAICESDGVLIVAKPVNRALFWAALTLARSVQNRVKRIQAENARLRQKIEDIKIVDRAKCTLMAHRNMSEEEAHKYIEKRAMDTRSPKRAVAEGILQDVGNKNY